MRLMPTVIASTLLATAAFAAPKYATEQEFRAAVVGHTITSKTQKGVSFWAIFKSDGNGDFQQDGKKQAKFKWTANGTTFCWDFGDFKECNQVEIVSPAKANFYDAKSGKLNNAYAVK
jgi:hypothetical protein